MVNNSAFSKILGYSYLHKKTLTLYFRNIKNDIIEMKINLYDKNIKLKEKWYDSLIDIVKNSSITYSKGFSLVGGFSKNRDVKLIVSQLLYAIKILKAATWYKDYDKINEDYSVLFNSYDQDLLNKLHHHFELLHGQVWSQSQFYEVASGEERFAISRLNLCCHELEAYYNSKISQERMNAHGLYFYYAVCGVANFKEITLQDKMNFTRDIKNGMVYLHYAQTGKTWYEAFLDNDDLVETNNISEHRLISGEFSCYIGPEFKFHMSDEFKTYIKNRGYDWSDPNLAIGYCPIGEIISVGDFKIQDFENCQKLLEEYDDFYGIELDKETKIFYDYRSDDETFYKKMCQNYETHFK